MERHPKPLYGSRRKSVSDKVPTQSVRIIKKCPLIIGLYILKGGDFFEGYV
jgi:hypothetical protein